MLLSSHCICLYIHINSIFINHPYKGCNIDDTSVDSDKSININSTNDIDLRYLHYLKGAVELISSGDIYLNNIIQAYIDVEDTAILSGNFKAIGVNLFAGQMSNAGDMEINVSNLADLASLTWIGSIRITGGGTLLLSSPGLRVERKFYLDNVSIENLHLNYAYDADVFNSPTLTMITGSEPINIIQDVFQISNNTALQSLSGVWRIYNLYIEECKSFFQPLEGSSIDIRQTLSISGSNMLAHLGGFYSELSSPVDIYLEDLPAFGTNSPTVFNFSQIKTLTIKNAPLLTHLDLTQLLKDLDLSKQSSPVADIFLSGLPLLSTIEMNFMPNGKCPFNGISIEKSGNAEYISIYFRSYLTTVPIRLEPGKTSLLCTDSGSVMKRCSSGNVFANFLCP